MFDSPIINEIVEKGTQKDNSFVREVLKDFWTCCISREASLLARREVLTGKAKFGITGDGKEVPQVAMARAFKKGDWRSGYYRDQTLMFALELSTVEDFFAQLYADHDNDPFSGGRQMNSHYATPMVDKYGEWVKQTAQYNTSSDISSTGGQMARGLGLAIASKKYRESEDLRDTTDFSENGNEVCFCTIGDASTSEGIFWETVNAAGVTQVPMAISVWDDGYGISVPKKYQTTKGSISEVLEGFRVNEKGEGMDIYNAKGWNYPELCAMYDKGIEKMRRTHTPALFHIEELTQPQGHSTSGSHERYKTSDRLEWEKELDCIKVMAEWMVDSKLATESEIESIKAEARKYVRQAKNNAWSDYYEPIKIYLAEAFSLFERLVVDFSEVEEIKSIQQDLKKMIDPLFAEIIAHLRRVAFVLVGKKSETLSELHSWLQRANNIGHQRYHTHLYSESDKSALKVPAVPAKYSDDSPVLNGFQILNKFFDHTLANNPQFFAFGEDVGHIGDVNQGFAGLQEKYGKERVFDTGIREWTIMGTAIGMAMRGLRPIAEIQYLDYLIYGLQPLTDDLATLRYRSNGQQCAPAIIRTRGHRLEGIWHSGSPLGMMIHSLRGIYLCVPRNMTQAVGFYNTMLHSNDPAIIIECLNGYRLKERLPENLSAFKLPLGVPEVLQEGADVTLVTYGSCVRVAQAGIRLLANAGISVELIDVQTLLPFDLEHSIVQSLEKTNRIVFMDEDVPGGATSYMMQEVLETQNGYRFLDAAPITLTAKAHRPPYGSDGDYFTKPNPEDVFETIYNIMSENDPLQFPALS